MKKDTKQEIYRIIDSFLVEAKDQNGRERSLEQLNRDRHLAAERFEELIRQARQEIMDSENKAVKKQAIKEFCEWLEEEDRQNWEIERYVESLLRREDEVFCDTVGEAWIELVRKVMGGEVSFDEGRERKSLQVVRVRISNPQSSDEIVDKFGSKKNLKALMDLHFNNGEMWDFDVVPSFPPGADSYYKRMKDGRMVDFVIKRLTRFPESKKAIIVFPNKNDYKQVLENPLDDYLPCMCSLHFRLQPNEYSQMGLIFYARSLDVYQKAYANLLAAIKLGENICEKLSSNLGYGIEMGFVDGLIGDAHIYKECWDDAVNLLRKYDNSKYKHS